MNLETLIEIRKVAEASVADMPAGELKTAAFQTILKALINPEIALDRPAPPQEPAAKGASKGKSAVKRPSSRSGTTGRLIELVEEGFFNTPKSLPEIQQELAAKGWYYRQEDLGTPVRRLTQKKALRRTSTNQTGKRLWKYSQF